MFVVYVNILPHPQILDPQGKATLGGLHHLGFEAVQEVRVGKRIQLQVAAASADQALKLADEAAKKLLANPITEVYTLEAPVPVA